MPISTCPVLYEEMTRRAREQGQSLTSFVDEVLSQMLSAVPDQTSEALAYFQRAFEERRVFSGGLYPGREKTRYGRLLMVKKAFHEQISQRAELLSMQAAEYLDGVLRVFLGRI